MKDINELEDMTWWEITVNEGALTLFVLGISMLLLSVMCVVMGVYYKIKFWR